MNQVPIHIMASRVRLFQKKIRNVFCIMEHFLERVEHESYQVRTIYRHCVRWTDIWYRSQSTLA